MDPIEIDTRVSPALHPDSVPTNDEGVRAALGNVYTELRLLHQGEAAVRADPSLSDYGKNAKLAEKRELAFKAASRELDRAQSILESHVATHERLVAQALVPQKTTVDAKEIRAYVANLSDSKRAAFVLERAAVGDAETFAAIFAADVPPYLSGLAGFSAKEVADLKLEAERRLSGAAHEKLDGARSTVARLAQMRRVLEATYGPLRKAS